MRWYAVVLSVSLGACDWAFGVDPISEPAHDAALLDVALLDVAPDDVPPDAPACPVDYAPIADAAYVYRIVTLPVIWELAFEDCNNDSPAGITHLVVFDGLAHLIAVQSAYPGTEQFHVGYARNITDEPLNGGVGFRSVLGEPVLVSLWGSGEPDNTGGVETVVHAPRTLRLVDAPPNEQVGYVCACDQRPGTTTFRVE